MIYPVYIALLAPRWLYYFYLSDSEYNRLKINRLFSVTLAIAIACCFSYLSFHAASKKITASKNAAAIFKRIYRVINPDESLLYLGNTGSDYNYLFEYYFKRSGRDFLVVSPDKGKKNNLDLGAGFANYGSSLSGNRNMVEIKELFMRNYRVWVLENLNPSPYISESGTKLSALFSKWSHTSGLIYTNKSYDNDDFRAYRFHLKHGIDRKSPLLDMFLIDYDDKESAARLVRDEDFTPEMMGVFLEMDGVEHIWERVLLLSEACGSDNKCRSQAMEKVLRYAAGENSGIGGKLLLEAVLDTYNKMLGGGEKESEISFD
ncbi:hypothetical protein ACFLQK_00600 [bacterium]